MTQPRKRPGGGKNPLFCACVRPDIVQAMDARGAPVLAALRNAVSYCPWTDKRR